MISFLWVDDIIWQNLMSQITWLFYSLVQYQGMLPLIFFSQSFFLKGRREEVNENHIFLPPTHNLVMKTFQAKKKTYFSLINVLVIKIPNS